MGHAHGGHGAPASASGRHVRRLAIAFAIAATFLAVELTVALVTGSLALLSDAMHMLTDVFGIGAALAAILIAARVRPGATRTFGMYRSEVFAALLNAMLLFGVAGYVLVEAARRFADPPEVAGLPVMLAASVGIAANLVMFLLLRAGSRESLNLRGAYLEVLADLVASIGVLASGAITLVTGWVYADPLAGLAIAAFVLPRAYTLGRSSLRILFQHAPQHLDVPEISARLERCPGVLDAHDLHVWTLTSGMEVASAHVTIGEAADEQAVLHSAKRVLAEDYGVAHATVQVETPESARHCDALSW